MKAPTLRHVTGLRLGGHAGRIRVQRGVLVRSGSTRKVRGHELHFSSQYFRCLSRDALEQTGGIVLRLDLLHMGCS